MLIKFFGQMIILSILLMTSCTRQADTITVTENSNGDAATNTGGNTGTGGSGSGSGSNSGAALFQWTLFLAGHQTWLPGTYSDSLATSTMPTIEEAVNLLQSDNRLQIRFKVNSQPYPTKGEVYCYGRQTGQAADAKNYTKLRFRVHLRDVYCDQMSGQNCLAYSLGGRYRTQYIDPVSVGSNSPIINLGSLRNVIARGQTVPGTNRIGWGTIVEVDDVKSDSTCQYNNTYCPAEYIVRAASCWSMTMEISTDYTRAF